MHGIASFTNFMDCWIIALLCAFSSKRGKSDVVAVGEPTTTDILSPVGESHMEQAGMLVGNFEFNP